MTTRSSTAKKMANSERVDDNDDFVDKIPIIKTMNLVKTTSGRVYKRLCDEEVLVGKAGLKVTCFCNVWVGAKSIPDAVSASEMAELKESAFGIFFKLGGIKWVNGQLLILLALNHVEPIKRSGDVDRIKFHIGDRIVEFKKSDFALITGLKFGKEAEYGDTDLEKANDISTRYFNGKMSVTRIQVENVFNSNKNSRGRERLDAVKLALLNFLVNHVVGNQGLTKIPALYMHLVDDLRRFNGFQWVTRESVQWTEMAATIAEKGKEKIAMLFSEGDASKAKINDGGGEHVDEGYGAGRRKLKGKLHWGNVDSTNEEEINGQPKEKGKVVIRKKTKGQKTDKKSDGSRGGASRSAPHGRQSDLGEGRENELSLRDIMTAIVVMEKRNMKMRTEVTKLRIALNAQSRVLNRFISMNRMEKKDATEPDVDDHVWDEGINVDAEIGTQPGEFRNDLSDPLNEICTQEVEGGWVKAVDTLGLGKRLERNVENEECGKGPTHMVEDDMLLGDVGTGIGVEDVLRTSVDETKAASPVNGDMSAMNMSGQGNAVQDLPPGWIFFTQPRESSVQIEKNSTERNVDRNSTEGVLNDSTNEGQVLRTGNDIDLLRAVYEEVQDPEDDAEVVVEEPSTQIVVYEAPIASETPPEWRAKQKRPLKCPDRFTLDDLAVRRKTKRVRIEGARITHFGGDEDEFMGPFPLDPKALPAEEALMKNLDVIFYYLRMKGVEFGMEQRYTTTDTPFLALMKTLCARSSCGMFMVKMAEFLMMGCDVGDMDDHEIAAYRKKMTVELLAYSAV
ncbi:unnamed protein product [Cuscuta campestris]|uniref:DUF1985 domain-containing protein n=1 Tax=Cuscuta campestris TaxID=132261 RepID=A0A484LIL2_9ASTE|nr:unnamed protein product [Cuscuta campestris]